MEVINNIPLENLKAEGWSYSVGYIQQFKAYVCRVYKTRDKPRIGKGFNGKGEKVDIHYFLDTYSGQGPNFQTAIMAALDAKDKGIREEKSS